MRRLRVALIGAGQRGKDVYSGYIARHTNDVQLVAVAEPNSERRKQVVQTHQIEKQYAFDTWEKLLALDKFCDAVIIATNDDMHFEVVKIALEKGYHILLEKPMSNKKEEILELGKLAKQYSDRIFIVSHVLRYTPFFSAIKQVLENGEIGELVSIQHNENIGYYHMAHSFVRGNWRNSNQTSPLILAKSCHDMDIISFLVGDKCKKVASFGSLKHFKEECAPQESNDRCLDCKVERSCPYSAKKIYLQKVGEWPANIITENHTYEGVKEALEKGPYGKCVYRTDNNVADHQVTILEFENGVSATFNLCGFTHDISRTIKLMGARGEIRGHMEKNQVEVHYFETDSTKVIDTTPKTTGHIGHGGGDDGLMDAFIKNLKGVINNSLIGDSKTSAIVSVESHKMALAAEQSRLTGKVVEMDEII